MSVKRDFLANSLLWFSSIIYQHFMFEAVIPRPLFIYTDKLSKLLLYGRFSQKSWLTKASSLQIIYSLFQSF